MDKRDLLRIIRRSQTFISITLFCVAFLFCWHVTDFKITEIQLSKWGESGITANIWNSIMCLLSISIFINSILYIKNNNRLSWVKTSYLMFGFVSICLFLVGAFNVNYLQIHNLAAYLYFFCYPFAIFAFTHLNRKTLQYRDWMINLGISMTMIFLPLIFIYMFEGKAIAEIVHTSIVILWNIKIATED